MLTTCFNYLKLLCIYLLLCNSAQGQDNLQNRLDSFSGSLITTIRSQSRPRAFLTSDKAIFKAGETIWFKAFLLNSASQKIITKTKFLFVDLVNENDKVLKVVVLDAAHQQLNSRIILPDSISTGYYWLRAYTRQMAKGDSNYCAIKSIYIFNNNSNTNAKRKIANETGDKAGNTTSINFYPEGGSIITGANSNVAFHIHDYAGKPIEVKGLVKDNRDSVITSFASDKSGLGKFSFFPYRQRKYKAFISIDGKELSYPLPAFNFKAAQLSISDQSTGAHLIRVLLEDSIYSKDFTTYVIGISKDSLCFASIGQGQYEVSIPREKLPGGITTFYLFDNNFKLLSERSVYEKEKNLVVNVAADKNNYDKRKKVTLKVSIADNNNNPVPALFSIAVIDSLFSDPSYDCNPTYIDEIINSENIDNMSLAHLQCLTDEEIDLIMLLRKNTFKNNPDNVMKALSTDEKDSLLHIRGIVLNEKNEPAINKIVNLLSKSGDGFFETDTTDDNGRFYFPIEDYPDSSLFRISVKNINERNQQMKIIPDKAIFPFFKTPVSLKQYLPVENTIKKYFYTYAINESISADKEKLPSININAKRAVNYDVSKRVSSNSSIVTSDDIPEGSSVGNAILGVAGMHMLNGFLVINGLTAFKGPDLSSEPLLLVDGQQASLSAGSTSETSPVMAYLNSLNSKEIDFIEILIGGEAANYGLRGGNGVILINTARNRKYNFKTGENNIAMFYPVGVSNYSQFPLVNYDSKNITSGFDNRSTIFWDGSVLSDPSGTTSFSFFTGDVPATYKVIVSGITIHGEVVYKTLTFHNK